MNCEPGSYTNTLLAVWVICNYRYPWKSDSFTSPFMVLPSEHQQSESPNHSTLQHLQLSRNVTQAFGSTLLTLHCIHSDWCSAMANLAWCWDIRDNSILSLSTRTLGMEENELGNHTSHIYSGSHMRDLRTELGRIIVY